jgi:hypothetical protein
VNKYVDDKGLEKAKITEYRYNYNNLKGLKGLKENKVR